MKVAIIFEMIPEKTLAYLIENPTEEQLQHLELANGKVANCDEQTDDMDWLDNMLAEDWKECEVKFPIKDSVDRIYLYGFAL
jgi:hypothetical protein